MGKTVVIGGGPAGMMAAGRLNARGKETVLIEKNPMLGKKLRITGKGRCNITNACDIMDIFENIPRNPRFLYSAIYSFSNTDVVALLENMGLKTKVERGMRVFPESDSAHDVAKTLERYALGKYVRLMRGEAQEIIVRNGAVCGVLLKDGRKLECESVIVATGGVSYPLTGSTGDGYRFAAAAGHSIVTPKASLVPVVTQEKWVKDLMGVSLKNIAFKVTDAKKRSVYEDFGEMLFTHFGVSGPVVLSASAHMRDIDKNAYTMHIDLKPALTAEQLDKRILRDFSAL
ncbi:MAG: aminoacetone oxidase family FAD-binding enzyme, partial [Clostridia bacterium]|nr:aminoacetone oxidase family FAD-binding enzyme [Clostridia bacterium]